VDVHNCFRDPRLSANRIVFLDHLCKMIGLSPEVVADYFDFSRKQMVVKDGADHLRLRRQISPSFSPQDLDRTLPFIRQSVNLLLDGVQERGHMDVVTELAYQLAPRVISDFLGIPSERQEYFRAMSEPIAKFASPAAGVDMVQVAHQANTSAKVIPAFLSELFEQRRVNAQQDALTQLLKRQQDEGTISFDELVANTSMLLIAGHLTTTDQLCNAVHDLLIHPEQLRKLQEDPTLIRAALEESLRFRPSQAYQHRIATEDIQLHGSKIPKGSILYLCIAAANRDPSVFPDADVFDVTRDYVHQKHVTFAFGPHHCIGAGLARRELTIALELLIQRLPGMRLDETRPVSIKCDSLMSRGFNSLPIRW
jgi:cytochrome P450 PksS